MISSYPHLDLHSTIRYNCTMLIQEADPQPVVAMITIFHTCHPYVQLSVRPHFSKSSKQNNIQDRIVIAIGGTVDQAEGIIDGTQTCHV